MSDPNDHEYEPLAGADIESGPAIAPEVVVLNPVAPAAPAPPAVWPVLAVGAGVFPASLGLSVVVLIACLLATGEFHVLEHGGIEDWFVSFGSNPVGLTLLVLPTQLVLLAAALLPVTFMRQPLAQRLGLGRGVEPWWSYPLLMLATPLIGSLAYYLVPESLQGDGGQLAMLEELFRQTTGPAVWFMIFLLSVVPAVVEEVFFRGFLQRGLLARWGPAGAIALTTALFAMIHMDLAHALAVLPLGAWLGVIAWRCGSVQPAILCHLFNNATAIVATRLTEDSSAPLRLDQPTVIFLSVTGAALLGSVLMLSRCSPVTPARYAG